MRFLRPDIGDLCEIHHMGRSPIAHVSDEDLHMPRFKATAGDLAMVTHVVDTTASQLARQNLASFLTLEERMAAMRGSRVSGEGHRVLSIVMASGQHVGMVGYVPSFWLRIVQPAPLR